MEFARTNLCQLIKVDGARLPSRAGPLLGADTDAILSAIGYGADGIAALRAQNSV